MSLRFGALVFAASLLLAGCPPSPALPDASAEGFDAGNPSPKDACSGGCAASQLCDMVRHVCVDACGGCDGGTCVKTGPNQYACQSFAATCGGNACQEGQVACVHGACSCISNANGSFDSCQAATQWCHGAACKPPAQYEQCNVEGTACETGLVCSPVFGTDTSCAKDCSFQAGACERGELCGGAVCLPSGLFNDGECQQNVFLPDGGFVPNPDGGTDPFRRKVAAGNTCLQKDSSLKITELGLGTGNCTYAFFRFWSIGNYTISTCRPPGAALEGQACNSSYAYGKEAKQCATGLQCVVTGADQNGVCLRMCNANPPRPGFVPQPACGTGESCVNVFRHTDPNDNSVLGVCMKSCNVFDPTTSACADVGTTHASCVPSTADGQQILSTDGTGICAPQQATVSQLGATCAQPDPFAGASCASGQLCTSGAQADQPPSCTQVCDLDCTASNPPAKCATEANAKCPAGKACTRVTSTTGAIVGLCK